MKLGLQKLEKGFTNYNEIHYPVDNYTVDTVLTTNSKLDAGDTVIHSRPLRLRLLLVT